MAKMFKLPDFNENTFSFGPTRKGSKNELSFASLRVNDTDVKSLQVPTKIQSAKDFG